MSAFDLKYHEHNRMVAFQDEHFTPEEVEAMEWGADVAKPTAYTWVYFVGKQEYRQTLNRTTNEITLNPTKEPINHESN